MKYARIAAVSSLVFVLALACACSPQGQTTPGSPSDQGGIALGVFGGPTKDDPAVERSTLGALLNDIARDVDEGKQLGSYSAQLLDEGGEFALSFDLGDATLSSPIPCYILGEDGVPEPFHIKRSPLLVGDDIVGFALYEGSRNEDAATYYIGISEVGSEQASAFYRDHGSIALVYDGEGAWMVSGESVEKIDAEVMEWLKPVNVGGFGGGMSLAPNEFSACAPIAEADLSGIEETLLEYRRRIVPSPHDASEDILFAKPVIYLYPEESCVVEVGLALDGTVDTVYPAFSEERSASEGSWKVQADPDGTLSDLRVGREYGYLFWEGVGDWEPDFDRGFCIAGADTAEFLEDALRQLGLTDKEADDFITYWLPQMQGNPYNLVSFQGEAYDRAARLMVEPQPDTIIRVFMAWMRLDEPVVVEPQALSAPARSGFTVVEWGGGEVEL